MARVHVWLPDSEHIGHTSISLTGRYISFWPEGGANAKDIKIKRSHPGMLMDTLEDDIENEGNRYPITIDIPELNEAKILDYLKEITISMPHYQIARNNCSHIVAKALMAGTDKKPSFTPHAGFYTKNLIIGRVFGLGIWTPHHILKFAKELSNS